jgi:hypothetical protein
MNYERPAVAGRRDITAELAQLVNTSGTKTVANPTWRRPSYERPAVEARRDITAELAQGVITSGKTVD